MCVCEREIERRHYLSTSTRTVHHLLNVSIEGIDALFQDGPGEVRSLSANMSRLTVTPNSIIRGEIFRAASGDFHEPNKGSRVNDEVLKFPCGWRAAVRTNRADHPRLYIWKSDCDISTAPRTLLERVNAITEPNTAGRGGHVFPGIRPLY